MLVVAFIDINTDIEIGTDIDVNTDINVNTDIDVNTDLEISLWQIAYLRVIRSDGYSNTD